MTPTTEQALLLHDLSILRELMDMPTTLSPKRFKIAQNEAVRLGDRCWYYAGWYAAQPDQTSQGVGKPTHEKLRRLIKLVQAHAKPKRGRGRPTKSPSFTEALITLPAFEVNQRRESQASVVNALVKRGLLDSKKTTEAHIKHLSRLAKKTAVTSDKK